MGQTEGRWTDALDLQAGDRVWKADGTSGVVQSVVVVLVQQKMYNLTVDEAHTFFVGEEQWLVHNDGCLPNNKLAGPPSKRGNAPLGEDGFPVELHHDGQMPDSELIEMTRTDHRLGDNFAKNHSNTGQDASNIDRKEWRRTQKEYWRQQWDSGRFNDVQPE